MWVSGMGFGARGSACALAGFFRAVIAVVALVGSLCASGPAGAFFGAQDPIAQGAVQLAATVETGIDGSGPAAPGDGLGSSPPLGGLQDPSMLDPGQDIDLQALLVSAGFADAVMMSGQDLKSLGDHFAAGWIAPSGDLFGLLFVVPADEPESTIGAFLSELGQSCPAGFMAVPEALEVAKSQIVGRASAVCEGKTPSLYYDMIFYFAATATLGITHVGLDATEQRMRKINGGLIDIMLGW